MGVDADRQLFYLHLPKSAGTTLIELLDQHFTDGEIFPEHYDLDRLRGYTDEQLQSYAFIRGHFPYHMIVDRLAVRPRTVTVLREPNERLVSNFEMRRRVDDPRDGLRERLARMTLSDFLSDPQLMFRFGNYATKWFGHFTRDNRGVFQPNLPRATEHLESFDAVGLYERLDDSVELILSTLGLPGGASFEARNVTPAASRLRDELTPADWDMVSEANRLDLELYQRAKARFEAAWAEHQSSDRRPRAFFDARRGVELDMTRADPGFGWYPAEAHGVFKATRWTGPGTSACVHLTVDGTAAYRLEVQALGWGSDNATLTIRANGTPIALQRSDAPSSSLFSGAIDPIGADLCRLELAVSEVARRHPDARLLGVCVNRISLRMVN